MPASICASRRTASITAASIRASRICSIRWCCFPKRSSIASWSMPHSGRAEGVEMLMQVRQRGAWSGWMSYTWSQVTDRIGNIDVPRSWDQRHAINLGVTWASGPWTATMINSFHSGWPTTLLGADPQTGEPRIDLSERNRSRFADYNSLDLRLTRTFIMPRGALDVFIEASNAFSRENPCCAEYEVKQNADGSLNYRREV